MPPLAAGQSNTTTDKLINSNVNDVSSWGSRWQSHPSISPITNPIHTHLFVSPQVYCQLSEWHLLFTFGQNSCFYSSQVLWRRLPKLSMFWLQSGRIAILLDSGCAPDWEWQSMFIHSRGGGGGGGMPLHCPFTPLSFVLAAAAAGLLYWAVWCQLAPS